VRFAGWPDAAFDVLLELEGEPSRVQLHAHRADLERHVREPMQLLCDDLNDDREFGTFYLGGLTDRPAMWQRQTATAWISRRVRITISLDVDGLAVEGGSANAAGDQVPVFRRMVAAEASGGELAGIVDDLHRDGFELVGPTLRRVPAGYGGDHPRAALLRRRSVFARKCLDADPHRAASAGAIVAALRPLHALTTWCVDHVSTTGWEHP
jgi:uncharacterized protein (DUF2461 family)